VLMVGLIRTGPPCRKAGHRRAAVTLFEARIIVLDAMAVPRREPPTGGVRRLQVDLRLVQRVALAIVVERQHTAARRHAHRVLGIGIRGSVRKAVRCDWIGEARRDRWRPAPCPPRSIAGGEESVSIMNFRGAGPPASAASIRTRRSP
jgi:hypothetical protein